MMLRTSLLFLVLLMLPVRANLGETVKQCVARYGRPASFSEANPKFPFGTLSFVAGAYTLTVFLIGDKEVGARVAKKDKTAFTDNEMASIMTADSPPAWTAASSDDPTCLRWLRPDKATVLYDKPNHVLIFTSEEMAKALTGIVKQFQPATNAAPVTPQPTAVPTTPAK